MIPFGVPPLRERIEDIPLLASYFLEEFAEQYGRKHKVLSPEAVEALCEYGWPGNVRELKNLVERIVIMNPQSRIDRKHLPALLFRKDHRRKGAAELTTLQQARAAYERDFILRKLEENQGNVSRAAQELGLERSHLYRKMKTLGIAPHS